MKKPLTHICNAKEAYEVLMQVRDGINRLLEGTSDVPQDIELESLKMISGLAMCITPRNCDVGTADELWRRFKSYCDDNVAHDKLYCQTTCCSMCMLEWMLEDYGLREPVAQSQPSDILCAESTKEHSPEKIPSIIAEMRKLVQDHTFGATANYAGSVDSEWVLYTEDFSNRLDAAYKRELGEVQMLRKTLSWVKDLIVETETNQNWCKKAAHTICNTIEEALGAQSGDCNA